MYIYMYIHVDVCILIHCCLQRWEEEKAAKMEAKRVKEAQVGFDQLDLDSDGTVSLSEIQQRVELDDDGDGEVSDLDYQLGGSGRDMHITCTCMPA